MALRVLTALVAFGLALPRSAIGQSADSVWTRADSIVKIGKAVVVVRASAWRDFMPQPGGTGRGSDLMVSVQLASVTGPLPAGLTVDSAWVRSREGFWPTAPSREPRPEIANGTDIMLRGGPKWGTGEMIDVLLRLRLPSGATYYLQRRRTSIGATQ